MCSLEKLFGVRDIVVVNDTELDSGTEGETLMVIESDVLAEMDSVTDGDSLDVMVTVSVTEGDWESVTDSDAERLRVIDSSSEKEIEKLVDRVLLTEVDIVFDRGNDTE